MRDQLLREREAHAAAPGLALLPEDPDLAQEAQLLGRRPVVERGLGAHVVELRPAADERSVDVHGELFTRMTRLDAEKFEGVLRPAFQQDEWKLIVAGGVLGLGAGVLQVVYMFGEYLA